MIPHPLHDWARCPYDVAAGPLAVVESSADGSSATLRCPSCGRTYPISDGIYRLMPDELRDDAHAGDAGGDPVLAQMKREMRQRDERASTSGVAAPAPPSQALDWMGIQFSAVTRHVTVAAGAICADFGCGAGRYTTWLLERCDRIIATDFSYASLRALARSLDDSQRRRCILIQTDLTRLALASSAVDQGLSVEVLQHIPSAALRADALAQLARALKPGARLVLVTKAYSPILRLVDARDRLTWWFRRMLGDRSPRPRGCREDQNGPIYTYRHSFHEARRAVTHAYELDRALGIISYASPPLARLPQWLRVRADRWCEQNVVGRWLGRDLLFELRRKDAECPQANS
ncbi:MAG: class I SAM-dependent methyltransferase [Phycisphaerae bacterium]|nr:class I SAM-dependent methyltransferase [Phycisphaerae bacterium]